MTLPVLRPTDPTIHRGADAGDALSEAVKLGFDGVAVGQPNLSGRAESMDGGHQTKPSDFAASGWAITSDHLSVAYDRDPVLWNVAVRVRRSKMTGVIGPNGGGKSTLIRTLLGLQPKLSGKIRWQLDADGPVTSRPLGRDVAYVPQRAEIDWDFPITVFDLALMGTYGELRWFARPKSIHRERAAEAIEAVGLSNVADRLIGDLSGGQQQRAFLARAIAQRPRMYLLDEPLAGVDVATEHSLLAILRQMRDVHGHTVVMVHHDLATATDYFDDVVLVNREIIAQGSCDTALCGEHLGRAFGNVACDWDCRLGRSDTACTHAIASE